MKMRVFQEGTWVLANPQSADSEPLTLPAEGSVRNIGTLCAASNIGKRIAYGATQTLVGTRHLITCDATSFTLGWEISQGFLTSTAGADYLFFYSINSSPPKQVALVGSGHAPVRLDQSTVKTLVSERVEEPVRAGDWVTIYTHATATASGAIPADLSGERAGDLRQFGPVGAALEDAYPLAESVAAPETFSMRPARIAALSDKPSILCFGDSIMQQEDSYLERACAQLHLAAVKSAQGGAGYFHGKSMYQKLVEPHLPYVTHWLDEFGTNDSQATWDATATLAVQWWQWAKEVAPGVEIIKTTITPRPSSSDNWVTQIPYGGVGKVNNDAFNAWLRAGAPLVDGAPVAPGTAGAVTCDVIGFDGKMRPGSGGGHLLRAVIDIAGAIESAPDSGIFNESARALMAQFKHRDGLHFHVSVHALVAQRVVEDLRKLGISA